MSAMSVPELIRIVSRDSPMALAQVERVRAELAAARPGVRTEVVPGAGHFICDTHPHVVAARVRSHLG